ncbi:MAG: mandelate racemase [Devosiaceae bacterium]
MSLSPAIIQPLRGRIGITNAKARMPFRFGAVTIEAIAGATLALYMRVDGQEVTGYSSELLAYKWFDKRAEKTPRDNIHDLLDVLNTALDAACQAGSGTVFELWQQLDKAVHAHALAVGFNDLGACYGVAMLERAMMDGVARAKGMSVNALLRSDVLGLRPGEVFTELAGTYLVDSLPDAPLEKLAIRHTVGMVDPLTKADLDPDNRQNDGLPETLEDYVSADALRYLKIKLGGDVDTDCARLETIGAIMAAAVRPIAFTLDGNEQFRSLDDFANFVTRLRASPSTGAMLDQALFIEQPLDRVMTFSSPPSQAAFEAIGIPLLIDEADGTTTAFHEAMEIGYRGVSHKNCKGVIKTLLNAMLITARNGRAGDARYFQSAEDLTCMPVHSLNADLALVSALGITHTERNSHHYFAGLGHLSRGEREAALAAHPDLYDRQGSVDGVARLRTHTGYLLTRSTNTVGFGTSLAPDMDAMTTAGAWTFESLGLSGDPS